MILPLKPDDVESADDPPRPDHCSLLDKYWDSLRGESELDLRRFIDRQHSNESITGDLEVLNLLHQVRCVTHACGEASDLPADWFSEPVAMEAGSRAMHVGAEDPPTRGEGQEAPPVPERIGKYRVVEMLDEGGQAQVFRVIHPELKQEYALKLARRPMAIKDRVGRDALEREGRLLAQCEHPNLVRVIDLDVHEGRRFVVMEYVKGPTLQQLVAQGLPAPRQAARLVIELARAVADLHERGIVNQDIKPQNVLVDDRGRPRLIDFGLARQNHAWCDDADDWTGGTAGYMSPEQAMGRADLIGPRTDVFGLGGLLYHLLTGRPLYLGSSPAAAFRLAREARTIPVRQLNPRVPRALERICHKALAAEPEQRYPTAVGLERALKRSLAGRWIATATLIMLLLMAALLLALRPIAPRIVSLEVEHFRGNPAESLGLIGLSSATIRDDDDIRVSVQLNASGYVYLIALNPDGKVQLCLPSKVSELPPRSAKIHYPLDDRYFGLTDGPGLQAFVAIASRRPLAPGSQWKAGLDERWKPAAAAGGWRYDGHRFTHFSHITRGELRPRSGPPAPFQEVCEFLKNLPEVEAIQAIAFSVKSKT